MNGNRVSARLVLCGMGDFLHALESLASLSQLGVRGGLFLLSFILLILGVLIPFDPLALIGLILLAGVLLSWVWQLLVWLYNRFS